jgi:hypothetical protein
MQGTQSSPFIDISDARPNYSAQNLYVQPPTRGLHGHSSSQLSASGIPGLSPEDEQHVKSNLTPRGPGMATLSCMTCSCSFSLIF